MKIAVMLRAFDRPGGIGIYSRNILDHLLARDSKNESVLLWNNPDHVGRYGVRPGLAEELIPPANPMIWDQWHAPRVSRKHGADLIFHTKFTVPLWGRAKTVMTLHGASWFVKPEFYGKFDVFYVKRAMPVYCRKADFLISNSECTTRDFVRILGVPEEKIATIHLAAGDEFRPVESTETLDAVRSRYRLPERFILTVTSYEYRKNFKTLLAAFESCRRETDVDLVVVGKNCAQYVEDFDLAGRGLADRVHFPGWVDQADLPAIYSLADAFGFPSIYEEFGIPVVEAMSCGVPIAGANTGALPELTGGAALLCDPFDAGTLGANLLSILTDPSVAARCRAGGLEQAKRFSWTIAAEKTLGHFERLAGS